MRCIETEIWEPVPENPRQLRYVGQRTAQEVFAELKHLLESTGYLPDEYFMMDDHWRDGKEIPKGANIFCTADYGGSEGIYLDVCVKWSDQQQGKNVIQTLATGKTLGESGSDMDRMHLIASAVVKAFYGDGLHVRYAGEKPEQEGMILHLNPEERRVFLDSLAAAHQRFSGETLAVENLLRRVAGSVTEYVDEMGARPARLTDYDRAVLAVQDGDLAVFKEASREMPQEQIGDLLVSAAARPGRVGREMVSSLLGQVKDAPVAYEIYLPAGKNAVGTGDLERARMMLGQAETCVAGSDRSLYGEVICEAVAKHMAHMADGLTESPAGLRR